MNLLRKVYFCHKGTIRLLRHLADSVDKGFKVKL
jgi:hypothetical protein